MDLPQQKGLVASVGQFVDHKHVLTPTLLLFFPLLDADRPHVDELQDAGGEQVVIVGIEILVGIQNVVGLLQVAVHRDVAEPEQVLIHLLTGTPHIDEIPDASHNGHDEEAYDQRQEGERVRHRPLIIIAHIVAAFKSQFLLMLEGILVADGRLKESLVEAAHHIQRTAAAEGLRIVGHDLPVVKTQLTAETETPHAAVLHSQHDGILCLDSHMRLIGLGRHAGIEKHMTDGVGIRMGMYQVGVGIARDIRPLTAVTKSPAEFIAAVLRDDAAFAGLPASALVDVPAPHVLIRQPRLVGHLQVAHLAALGHTYADIALRTLGVDAHQPRLRDPCVTVMTQHHADVKPMQLWTCEPACC